MAVNAAARVQMAEETIEIMTIEGKPWRVNRAKFEAMDRALMAVLPAEPPGLSFADLKSAIQSHLDQDLFPGGVKAGWWMKSVQLDHEFRGTVKRSKGSPLRFYKVQSGS